MTSSQDGDSMRSGSRLGLDNLRAQLAPLDTYGLGDVTSALVDGLVALIGASRKALCACDSHAAN